jgi:hypothetical protein
MKHTKTNTKTKKLGLKRDVLRKLSRTELTDAAGATHLSGCGPCFTLPCYSESKCETYGCY